MVKKTPRKNWHLGFFFGFFDIYGIPGLIHGKTGQMAWLV